MVTAVANIDINKIHFDFRVKDIISVDVNVGGKVTPPSGTSVAASTLEGGTVLPSTFSRNIVDENNTCKLEITLSDSKIIEAGTEFVVKVVYTTGILDDFLAANPESAVNLDKRVEGFQKLINGIGGLACGEPLGSPYWYPCNNMPSDAATYRLNLTAPNGYAAVGAGYRSAIGTASGTSGRQTAVWTIDKPITAYQQFAYFSNDCIELSAPGLAKGTAMSTTASTPLKISGGRTIQVYAYVNRTIYSNNMTTSRNRDKADYYYGMLGYYIQELEKILGPYPYDYAGFVLEDLTDGGDKHASWGAIETSGRPVCVGQNFTSESTLIHELIHNWCGNDVRVDDWQQLWLNEGMATYLSDYFYEKTKPQTSSGTAFDIKAKYENFYNNIPTTSILWKYPMNGLTSELQLFDGSSFHYNKGSLVVASLRASIGDAAFGRFLQAWTERMSGKAARSEDYVKIAEEVSGRDLTDWANAWVYGAAKPASWPTLAAFKTGADPAGAVYNVTQHFALYTGSGDKSAIIDQTGLTALKNGSATLVKDTDYTISEASGSTTITLKASYIATLANNSVATLKAVFGSDEVSLPVAKAVPDMAPVIPTVYNVTEHFALYTGAGNKTAKIDQTGLTALKNGSATLVKDTDYTVSEASGITTITLNKAYLDTIANDSVVTLKAVFGDDEVSLPVAKSVASDTPEPSTIYKVTQHFALFSGSGDVAAKIDKTGLASLANGTAALVKDTDYTVSEADGVTTITLKEAYLAKLDSGKTVTLTATFADGSVTLPISITATSDDGGLSAGAGIAIGAGAVAVLGGAGFAIWFFLIRRKSVV